jgi:protein O-GlcNAc transferase
MNKLAIFALSGEFQLSFRRGRQPVQLTNKPTNQILRKAESLQKRGDLGKARELYAQILQKFPKNSRAKKGLSDIDRMAQRQLPPDPPIRDLEAVSQLLNQGRLAKAHSMGLALLRRSPNGTDINNLLGVISSAANDEEKAVAFYQRSLKADPNNFSAMTNLGVCLQKSGHLQAAGEILRKALQVQPDYTPAHKNLALVLKQRHHYRDAIDHLETAIILQPDDPEPYVELGTLYGMVGKFELAAGKISELVKIAPDSADAQHRHGQMQSFLGHYDEAVRSFDRAAELAPRSCHHQLSARLALPRIYENNAQIFKLRQQLLSFVEQLENKALQEGEFNPSQLTCPNFMLAYHNYSNTELSSGLCRYLRSVIPDLNFENLGSGENPVPEPEQKIRIGICSQYLYKHTIGRLFGGFVKHIDKDRFDVILIKAPGARRDDHSAFLEQFADGVIELPERLSEQRNAVAAQRLDVLFYPDIGMSPYAYFLAFSRLAPVQAVSWGHPDTTGIDTIDYFVTATTIEPENCEEQYSERCVRLNALPCYYMPHETIEPCSRADFGLPKTGAIYSCPQTLFKFHPDFDAVLAEIMETDPDGHLVLIEGQVSSWNDLLRNRWANSFPILNERAIFLPAQSHERFLGLLDLADVLLDPIHFGSGNTLYEAMMFGTPIITWPGQFMRGRIVAGAYRQMGVEDAPIAPTIEDYAPLALALGRDAERRHKLRETLKEAAKRELFEDEGAVRELEAFFEAAVASARRGEKLPDGWSPKSSAKELQ